MEGSADRTDGIYSIGAVARMLGVPAQTLRAWEDRYQQIVPVRSSGGQRLYSRDQVDQLSFIRNQIDQGLQPADAHRLLAQQQGAVLGHVLVESRGPELAHEAVRVVLGRQEQEAHAAQVGGMRQRRFQRAARGAAAGRYGADAKATRRQASRRSPRTPCSRVAAASSPALAAFALALARFAEPRFFRAIIRW